MKKILGILLLLISFQLIYAINTQTHIVYFEKGQTLPNFESIPKDLLSAQMFYLEGSADIDGDEAFNLALSKKRVDQVKTWLISKGISPSKIHCSYVGETLSQDKISDDEKKEARIVSIQYLKDPVLMHEVKDQTFQIETSKDTMIVGKRGTKIFIPAKAFTESNVVLHMKEYYNPLDILSANLSTTSNGQPLETGGMIFLEAKNGSNVVYPNQELIIEFNNPSNKTGFQIFSGDRDSSMNVNWVLEPKIENFEKIAITDRYMPNKMIYTTTSTANPRVGGLMLRISNKFYDLPNYFSDNYTGFTFELVIHENGDAVLSEYKMPKFNEEQKEVLLKILREECKSEVIAGIKEKTYVSVSFIGDVLSCFGINQTGLTQSSSLNSVFKTKILGWINCDRYLNEKNLTNYYVEVAPSTNVRMIVKEYNSYFNSVYKSENQFMFSNIPLGKKVILLATFEKEGKYFLAIEHTSISEEKFTAFHFKEYSLDELKLAIANISM